MCKGCGGDNLLLEAIGQQARAFESFRDQVATTFESIRERGAHLSRIPPVGIGDGATYRATTVANTLLGWSFRELGGVNAAVVVLHDGPDVNGDEIASTVVGKGGVDRMWFGPGGLTITRGLTLEVLAGGGTILGSIILGSA